MAFKDVREHIARLEEVGELYRVKSLVDWNYEVAGWLRKSYDMKPYGPALLFENIKDYPGHRILSNAVSSYSRFAHLLELDPKSTPRQLIEIYKERLKKPVDPVMARRGPVKENILKGKDIDLLKFPVPWWTPRDGGRFIGTWHGCVSKDPKTGIRNIGMYRMQVFDGKHTGVGFMPHSHIGLHYSEMERQNKPLQMAVVIGADETIPVVAASGFPFRVDEYRMAGALRQAPIELVKCETVDIEVPANSEIVLEGRILPNERREEGPFGEHTGYHGGGIRMRPIFEVSCIMHRNDPIFRGSLLGKPIIEEHILGDILLSAAGLKMFEEQGPAGVTAIHCPPAGDSYLGTVIQMRPYYIGHSRDVARAWMSSQLAYVAKYVVVVDEDIDPFDLGQVWWAMQSRTQGSRDIEVLPFGRTSRSDPSVPPDRGEWTDRVIIDATKKLDYPYNKAWGGHWAPVCVPPDEIMELVELKWRKEIDRQKVDDKQIRAKENLILKQVNPYWEKWRQQAYATTAEEMEKEKSRSYPVWEKDSGARMM